MFSSKTPRDLNHDPTPWVAKPQFRSEIGRPKHHADTVDCAVYCVKEPRPEFDHVQHNAPNPILVWHRQAREEDVRLLNILDPQTSAEYTLEDLESFTAESSALVSPATPAQIDHARRVLTRLAQIGA